MYRISIELTLLTKNHPTLSLSPLNRSLVSKYNNLVAQVTSSSESWLFIYLILRFRNHRTLLYTSLLHCEAHKASSQLKYEHFIWIYILSAFVLLQIFFVGKAEGYIKLFKDASYTQALFKRICVTTSTSTRIFESKVIESWLTYSRSRYSSKQYNIVSYKRF